MIFALLLDALTFEVQDKLGDEGSRRFDDKVSRAELGRVIAPLALSVLLAFGILFMTLAWG